MKPRVLHVIPFLWSGAGRVVSRLAIDQQTQRDVAVVTSVSSRGQRDWPAYRRSLAASGVAHHRIDFFDRDPAVYRPSVDALDRLIAAWRPDVVHTHAGVAACAAAAVRRGGARRFRHINHVYNWGVGRPAWMNAMDLSGIRQADRVVCSAGAYRDLLLRHGVPASRIAYVPWGLELDRIAAYAPSRPRRARGPRIGFVGRIEPRKGQLELVRGFARYRRAASQALLELVGPVADRDYAAAIAKAVDAAGLGSSVSLTGHVRNPYRRMARWDLFVSLASDEGQGLAVLEAMALGVPVLARRVAGVEDYVEDGVNAWVCPGVSPSSVAGAVRRVLGDSGRARVVASARQMVVRKYAWSGTVSAIAQLYGD